MLHLTKSTVPPSGTLIQLDSERSAVVDGGGVEFHSLGISTGKASSPLLPTTVTPWNAFLGWLGATWHKRGWKGHLDPLTLLHT